MNRFTAYLSTHWEKSLFFLLLFALLGSVAGWHFLRTPQLEVTPPIKPLPLVPAIVPWEYRPLTFMHPDLNPKLPNPFLTAFDLPAPPEPPAPPVEEPPIVETPPPPPPPPPRTREVTYQGIYHSLLGKTIAYLKCNDSLTGETLVNLTIGDEVAPGFAITAIDNAEVIIDAPDDASSIHIPWQQATTLTFPAETSENPVAQPQTE